MSEEHVPEFEKEGLLKAKEVKTFGLNDHEITKILEFRRIAELQTENEGIFLDHIAISRFARDPKMVRLPYIDFNKKEMTIREYDPKDYENYRIAQMEKAADEKAKTEVEVA